MIPAAIERRRRDRPDRSGDDGAAHGVDEVLVAAARLRGAEQRVHGGRAREGDAVEPARAGGVDEPVDAVVGLVRLDPPVRLDGEHPVVRVAQAVELRRVQEAVQLHRDREARRTRREHLVDERLGGLLGAHPDVVEAGGADASAGLRPAHEDRRVGERVEQVLAEARGIRDLEPAAHAVRGRREQHVGSCGDDRAGVGDHGVVGDRVGHAERRARAAPGRRGARARR